MASRPSRARMEIECSWLDRDWSEDQFVSMAHHELISDHQYVVHSSCTVASACDMEEPNKGASQNLHNGPPYLRCSNGFGLSLFSALSEGDRTPVDDEVWVDWSTGSMHDDAACSLVVRQHGQELASAHARMGAPLRVVIPLHRTHRGVPCIIRLLWSAGERCLHVMPPLDAVCLSGCMLAPTTVPASVSAVAAQILADLAVEPALHPTAAMLDRGFGLELEFLMEPCRPHFTLKLDQVRARLISLRAAAESSADVAEQQIRPSCTGDASCRLFGVESNECGSVAHHPSQTQWRQLAHAFSRGLEWASSLDPQIMPSPQRVARRMAQALLKGRTSLGNGAPAKYESIAAPSSEWFERCIAMASGETEMLKTEFTSPLPPHELRFSEGAELQILAFVHGALATVGAAAPTLKKDGHCGSALHVHVNVRNPEAGGRRLCVDEVLRVLWWWIRFDLVTASFARPWMWRENSAAPMYATGAEFEYHEAAWDQGLSLPSKSLLPVASAAVRRRQYDVPLFVRALHAAVRQPGYDGLSDDGRVATLLQAADGLTRYLSLNIFPLAKFGTVEFRRFHGTTDAPRMARWAHFCVAFVECFAREPWPLLAHTTADEALVELQQAQELATAEELMQRMAGHVHPGIAQYFMRDALSTPTY